MISTKSYEDDDILKLNVKIPEEYYPLTIIHLLPAKLFVRGSGRRSPLKLTTFCTYKNTFLKNTMTIFHIFKQSNSTAMLCTAIIEVQVPAKMTTGLHGLPRAPRSLV